MADVSRPLPPVESVVGSVGPRAAPVHASGPDPARPGEEPHWAGTIPDAHSVPLPAFEPFRHNARYTLTPAELDVITTFYETYMSGSPISDAQLRCVYQDAAAVQPLMERQLEQALHSHGGEQAFEYRQVKNNLAWVNKVLASQG